MKISSCAGATSSGLTVRESLLLKSAYILSKELQLCSNIPQSQQTDELLKSQLDVFDRETGSLEKCFSFIVHVVPCKFASQYLNAHIG